MADALIIFIRVVLMALAALLPVINPPGLAPIFLGMTPGAADDVRTMVAARVARNCFALLTAAVLVGSYVLIFFGLSLAVVKIAGGLLVISTGWHLMRGEQRPDPVVLSGSATTVSEQVASFSFYPLTFPITIGPGAISVAVTIGAGVPDRDVARIVPVLGVFTGVLLASLAIYLSFRFASRLLRMLGRTSGVVLLRLSSFILLAIGVQILCDGLSERFVP